jgi:branched-chain amino acid transport system substrate-binding protein
MNRRTLAYGVLALTVGVAATACTPTSAADGNTVKVGVVVSLTGGSAPFGTQQKLALELAQSDINAAGLLGGKKLEFDFQDDHSDVAQSTTIYSKLINTERVAAIIGPTSSTSAKTTSHIAQNSKVPVLLVSSSASKGITDVGSYIWRDSLTDLQLVPQAVSAAKKKFGLKRGVLLYASDDASTQSSAEAFEASMRSNGIDVVKKLSFTSTDKDFASQLTEAKNASPDALFVSAVPQGGVGLLKQARQMGMTLPVIGGNGFNSPQFISGAGSAADNVLVAAAWSAKSASPLSQKFVADFKTKNGKDPDQFGAQAYAGAFILANAVKSGGADREGILKGLGQVKNLDTVLGAFSFTDGRDGAYDAVPLEIQNGVYQPLT